MVKILRESLLEEAKIKPLSRKRQQTLDMLNDFEAARRRAVALEGFSKSVQRVCEEMHKERERFTVIQGGKSKH